MLILNAVQIHESLNIMKSVTSRRMKIHPFNLITSICHYILTIKSRWRSGSFC